MVLGTIGSKWVAPRQGSTWGELFHAFEDDGPLAFTPRPDTVQCFPYDVHPDPDAKSNLLLTGEPLTKYDIMRYLSGCLE